VSTVHDLRKDTSPSYYDHKALDIPIVYVSSPHTPTLPGTQGLAQFFTRVGFAHQVSEALWASGVVAVCPEKNCFGMDGACDPGFFKIGNLALMRRCDAVVMLPGYEESAGCREEMKAAGSKPVFIIPADHTEMLIAVQKVARQIRKDKLATINGWQQRMSPSVTPMVHGEQPAPPNSGYPNNALPANSGCECVVCVRPRAVNPSTGN